MVSTRQMSQIVRSTGDQHVPMFGQMVEALERERRYADDHALLIADS
jgi:hypothetical protein